MPSRLPPLVSALLRSMRQSYAFLTQSVRVKEVLIRWLSRIAISATLTTCDESVWSTLATGRILPTLGGTSMVTREFPRNTSARRVRDRT